MKTNEFVSFVNVDLNMGFWHNRQRLNRDVTIHAVKDRFMDTGRFAAFDMNWREGMENKPHIFWDSDIAKWMESVAYLIEKQPMPELEAIVEEIIDKIQQHQDPCGYFNIYFTAVEPSKRWFNRDWHELYCAGHLIEAAVAWNHATGRDRFLRIMCKYADYIDRVFRQEGSASFGTPGHEEIELALVRLYHATGEEKYLRLSQWFIAQRGVSERDDRSVEWQARSHQDHLPCNEQFTAEGHAVRACYLYSGMADIARECGDEGLKNACQRLFDNITSRRMYVTAGIGSTHHNEAFTIDYDLPNQTAYTETCASIALAYFAHRMLLLAPESKYADVVEQVLYNGFLSGTSLDGKRFFYTNPLEIEVARRHANPSSRDRDWLPAIQRVEVFQCSCCPPNITRFVASLGDYVYTRTEDRLYVHQFMGNTAKIGPWQVDLRTEYPQNGAITLAVKGMKGKTLCLRIPGWCRKFTLDAPYTLECGYAMVHCDSDDLVLHLWLDLSPRLVEANPNVAADAGKVALQRGPVVYCLEGVDNGERLFDCMIDAQLEVTEICREEYGMPVLLAKGWQRPAPQGDWLYRSFDAALAEKTLTFLPYYAFANRGESDMRVWIPVKY